MEKFDFTEACVEACKLIEQQEGITIPLVANTIIDEWGLMMNRPSFGTGILSAVILYADQDGDLYTSRGISPRTGFRTYTDGDVEEIKRAFMDDIQALKDRIARKETDQSINETQF